MLHPGRVAVLLRGPRARGRGAARRGARRSSAAPRPTSASGTRRASARDARSGASAVRRRRDLANVLSTLDEAVVRPSAGHRLRPAPRRRRAGAAARRAAPRAEGAARPRRSARVIEELTRACVHCGFCLPTCPTYVLWSEEMDSPRGRIQLMEKTAQGTLRLSPTVVEHFDRCLGCMACVSSCPSGVQYDRLIEETRHVVEAEHRRPRARAPPAPPALRDAAVPAAAALGAPPRAARRVRCRRPPGRSRCSSSRRAGARASGRRHVTPARRRRTARGRVGLLTGCVQSVVLRRRQRGDRARRSPPAGYDVVAPRQGCCGALSAHAGRAEESRAADGAPAPELRRPRHDRRQRVRLRVAPEGPRLPGARRDRGAREAPSCPTLHAARADGRLPGLVPPPARTAAPRRLASRCSSGSPA